MGTLKLTAASGGGSVSIEAPASSSNNRVITLPDITDGTLVTSQSTLDATKLSGNLPALNGSLLTNVPSDVVKLQSATGTDLGGGLNIDNLDTSTYRAFQFYFSFLPDSTADGYFHTLDLEQLADQIKKVLIMLGVIITITQTTVLVLYQEMMLLL